ncbi:MAG: hypothetical protein AB3X44_09255 [Leptothrix sp. (in: b-proteobacteria)]
MNELPVIFAVAIVVTSLSGCGASEGDIFTLYRNSVLDENLRIHVATFDASDGDKYNKENCVQAQALFQAQPGIKTKFWCEKGRFKK